ncbi:copper resistance D domain-containing protein [Candidatus Nitrosopumilus koreensis AR1]|uniref:Copper resistance D domain-containing protein n=1 Tax=Candidatus Nitrosopumilus koreensis AR1 TaxID=1229908 RepID=K0B611_9ARCH|nr:MULTISPECIES: CopD family protein [Nitrosopumilus]AFS81638.1 copper resistance D domain-containing protein [Candidatus Nitrosopumilus koreensis AR1]
MQKFLITLLVISFISIPFATAHPFTEETIPSLTSNAPSGTTEVIVYFSEPVDINFSELKVFDTNGDQIDNKDTDYYEGELSLIITTPPLEDGVYTVSTKVLSKVDGHLVPDAFLFAVGDAVIDPSLHNVERPSETVFLPEAGARLPGLVGQTIVLGAVISSLIIWGTQNKQSIKDELEKIQSFHHGKFMSITGIGLVLVFISDILMIAVQTVRLEASPIDAIQTDFGNIWLIRMTITIVLLGIWFGLDRKKVLSRKNQIAMLVVSLVLIATTSLIGHGAASGETPALVLDYIHNLVAAVWIGGIFYFVFTLLPTFSQLKESSREKMSLLMIPRFSIAFIIAVGIVIITGPTLMWFLESDIGLITESIYGQLIILKIAIAVVIVAFGGFFQFKVQKNAERNFSSGKIFVHKKLKRSLKVDAVLGIILLGVVALLTNGTLPAGEIQKVDAQEIIYGFKTIEFTENAKFDIDISPFSSGPNTILIKVSDFEGNPLYDSDQLKVKISNPSKNIAPIEVPMEIIKQEENKPIEFQGELTFGFSGEWLVEVEAQRTDNASESKLLNLLVKPRLTDIQTQIIEYELPEDAKPLFPLYDGHDSIWVSDASAPRVWQFSLDSQEFTPYSFDGVVTTFLTQDKQDRIWFVDPPRNQIGFIDLQTKQITTKSIPKLDPTISDNTPLFIKSDFDGNIWITIINKDRIVKYIPGNDEFEEIVLSGKDNLPFALALDNDGKVWFSATGTGKIGYVDPKDNKLIEFTKEPPLQGPEALLFDDDGNLWIAEHTGLAITKFNPILETFERVSVPNEEALPFGMTFDRYGNVWFAQHTIDSIGAYDPDNNNLIEVPIPSETSFVQFMTSDGDNNVWFVEQQTNKIGTVKITEIPGITSQVQSSAEFELKYTELASPLIALGIIATSLFYVKSIQDKRRLNSLIRS